MQSSSGTSLRGPGRPPLQGLNLPLSISTLLSQAILPHHLNLNHHSHLGCPLFPLNYLSLQLQTPSLYLHLLVFHLLLLPSPLPALAHLLQPSGSTGTPLLPSPLMMKMTILLLLRLLLEMRMR